jgi:hypothetical protein
MLTDDDTTKFLRSPPRVIAHWVAMGQMGFAVGIGLCVILSPHLVLHADEGGISNFGVHAKTVVPYTVALMLPAVLTFRASRLVGSRSREGHLRAILTVYSGLILLTLLTTYTYKIDTPLKIVHVGVGVLLTVFEMGASLWMCRQMHALYGVVVVEFVGFVLAALTIVGALHLLFATQLIVGVAFAIILVQACRVVNSSTRSSPTNV